jgi:hypothetical protein
MWPCKACDKTNEDAEHTCQQCGRPRVEKKVNPVAARARARAAAVRKAKAVQGETDIDPYHEIDYSRYSRNWLNVFNRLSFRFAIAVYACPFFGLWMIYDGVMAGFRPGNDNSVQLKTIIGGVLLFGVSAWYINHATKIYAVKRRDAAALATAGN